MVISQEEVALASFTNKLEKARASLYPDLRDAAIFDTVLPKLRILIDKLSQANNRHLYNLRKIIRWELNRAVFSLYLKTAPRFFIDKDGKISSDLVSTSWTLEYYRIEPVLLKLTKLIQGKSILDPLAGSGNDMNLVAAFCQPKYITCSDIGYAGGQSVHGTDLYYDPQLNREKIDKIFKELPQYYQPHLSKIIHSYEFHDVRHLPYKQKEFDWVVTHPPFGINLKPGGATYFLTLLPEMLRVTSEGVIFSSPTSWKQDFKLKKIKVVDLTGDVTKGQSRYPSCFLMITH